MRCRNGLERGVVTRGAVFICIPACLGAGVWLSIHVLDGVPLSFYKFVGGIRAIAAVFIRLVSRCKTSGFYAIHPCYDVLCKRELNVFAVVAKRALLIAVPSYRRARGLFCVNNYQRMSGRIGRIRCVTAS